MIHYAGNRTYALSILLLYLLLLFDAFDVTCHLRCSRRSHRSHRSRCLFTPLRPFATPRYPSRPSATPCPAFCRFPSLFSSLFYFPRPIPFNPVALSFLRDFLSRTGLRIWIRDCVMHMQLHLASDRARPITAVKLDCRRLSTTDRPNKTRIFPNITALLLYLTQTITLFPLVFSFFIYIVSTEYPYRVHVYARKAGTLIKMNYQFCQ